jgi:hypothetical protein
MATEKQVQANRLNGLKGGVKTEAGKAKVRLNAVTHGFFSQETLIKGEDRHLMAQFREQLTAELKPEGEMETLLMELIISASWRLRRLLNYEKRSSRDGLGYFDAMVWEDPMKYATKLERQIYKAVHELKGLQRERLESQTSDTQNNKFAETNPISSQQSVAAGLCRNGAPSI